MEFVDEYKNASITIKKLNLPNKIHLVLSGKIKHLKHYYFKYKNEKTNK